MQEGKVRMEILNVGCDIPLEIVGARETAAAAAAAAAADAMIRRVSCCRLTMGG
jgi:hypothetical protein